MPKPLCKPIQAAVAISMPLEQEQEQNKTGIKAEQNLAPVNAQTTQNKSLSDKIQVPGLPCCTDLQAETVISI